MFIRQIIGEKDNAGCTAFRSKLSEIVTVESENEPVFLFGKLVHLWVSNTRDMEIIPQVFEIMPAVHAGKLCPGGHILPQAGAYTCENFLAWSVWLITVITSSIAPDSVSRGMCGYSSWIASKVYPAFKRKRILEIGTRVSAMTGFPLIMSEVAVIYWLITTLRVANNRWKVKFYGWSYKKPSLWGITVGDYGVEYILSRLLALFPLSIRRWYRHIEAAKTDFSRKVVASLYNPAFSDTLVEE
jgi:hypothetical protein